MEKRMLIFILSLPRSGSTVLTSILDRRNGVVCLPESAFPQILEKICDEERNDFRWMAALFLASSFSGTALTLDEAAECMNGEDGEILYSLGCATAAKTGRNPEAVRHVVWKTTRCLSFRAVPESCDGRFIILRRHPANVFESQFRVPFGLYNRNPLRFALFLQSYENALSEYRKAGALEIEYDRIPDQIEGTEAFLGIDGTQWLEGSSALAQVSSDRPWHANILADFKNTDPEKRAALNPAQRTTLAISLAMSRPLRPLLGPLRRRLDAVVLQTIRRNAEKLIG